MTINLIDARRGLHNKCLELFADKKIAEQIYRYLCDGIEDCETVEVEPTFEQVEEYCRKRCLMVVDGALFNEMKSRWSAEPKHGRWIWDKENDKMYCSECGYETDNWGVNQESDPIKWQLPNYCENCGARNDEVEE